MLKRDCKVGMRVRVVGKQVQKDFPRIVGAEGRVDEISAASDANSICVMFRRVVVRKDQKHLWLMPKEIEEVEGKS